jgi:hypothetical protein
MFVGDNGRVIVATDGCLPTAADRLYAAVAALVEPVKELVGGALLVAPSHMSSSSARSRRRRARLAAELSGSPPRWHPFRYLRRFDTKSGRTSRPVRRLDAH